METTCFAHLINAFSRRLWRRAALVTLGTASLAVLGYRPAVAQEGISATPDSIPSAGCVAATEDENEAVTRRLFDEALNERRLDVIDEIVAPDAQFDWATFPNARGAEEDRQLFGAILTGFPNVRFTVELAITEGDLVAMLWAATGTHLGEFQGIAPTGRQITWAGIDIYRIGCGQIVEGWGEVDGLGRWEQLTGVTGAFAASTPVAAPVTGGQASPVARCPATNEAQAEELAQRTIDVWGTHDLAALDGLLAADHVAHLGQGPDTVGLEPYKQRVNGFFSAFPDLRETVDIAVVEGDLVAHRWTETGTHEGPLGSHEPTGIVATWTGISIYRVECGQIVEIWTETDGFALQRQLGVDLLPGTPAVGTPAP